MANSSSSASNQESQITNRKSLTTPCLAPVLLALLPAPAGLAHTLLLCLLLLWLLALPIVARMRLRPPRMNDGKALYRLNRVTPADLNLPYENLTFEVPDAREGKLHLKGWWIPAATQSSRTVIILHGYADAKVGALAWAPFLHEAGHNLLLYDARAHGESTGQYCTAGYFERHDLREVIHQLQQSRPEAAQHLAILGISMGGVTALAACAQFNPSSAFNVGYVDEPPQNAPNAATLPGSSAYLSEPTHDQPAQPDAKQRATPTADLDSASPNQKSEIRNQDVRCLIVDSFFSDYSSAGILHASLFGLPGPVILRPATYLAQHLSGARFAEVAPLLTMSQQHQPTLLIQPGDDRVIAPEAAAQLRQRLLQSPRRRQLQDSRNPRRLPRHRAPHRPRPLPPIHSRLPRR